MEFRIADTFSDSLGRLSGDEQKAVKTTAFDLQVNAASPGLQFHKLDKAKDKKFWSVRVNLDLRIIVHRAEGSLLLCYVDHHDKAYAWAERRRLETHPKTGAAQFVEIRETVQQIVIPEYVARPTRAAEPEKLLFADLSDDELLSYGVPVEWLPDVRKATDQSIFGVAEHLPREATEALLELATGGKPRPPVKVVGDPFNHPDAQSRFRVMGNLKELEQALEAPWDKWTVFLHPEQRQLVERTYNGPARVSGSAGTGKTIVALHRAVHLARTRPDARVLLTTFSDALADALATRLRRLVSHEPLLAERIDLHAIDVVGERLYEAKFGKPVLATKTHVAALLDDAAKTVPGHKFASRFIRTEWEQVVDAWQLESWEDYRDVARLGRRTRLSDGQRRVLWTIFEKVRAALAGEGEMTHAAVFKRVTAMLRERKHPPYDYAVVDEAQDLSIAQLRFLAALGDDRPEALFFAGDTGQRIFQQPFSWKALGVDLRGRSRTLRVNYRTSHQIRAQADRLLGPEIADADGNADQRKGTVSVFNGPAPRVLISKTQSAEIAAVGAWLAARAKAGILPQELGVFVRSAAELPRACKAVEHAGLPYTILDDTSGAAVSGVSVATMHLVKGLEFRAVAVMACDDDVIPSEERIGSVGDDADLEEVYATERHLLYVACTRSRDELIVSGVEPASEFLDDFAEAPRAGGTHGKDKT